MPGSLDNKVLRELHRAAVLMDRAGITLVREDAPRADHLTGSRARTRGALRRLAQAERIVQVRQGMFVLPDSTGIIDVTLEELIAVVAPRPYMITGGRALEHHNLTNQHYFQIPVLVASPVAGLEWRQERASFRVTPVERIWGEQRAKARGEHRPRPLIAGPQRALLDAVSHPRFGVSLEQAARALTLCMTEKSRFPAELARSARRYGSASTARRIGLLVEHIGGAEAAEPFLDLIGESPTPVALRAGGSSDGPVDRKWRVRLNTNLDLLQATAS